MAFLFPAVSAGVWMFALGTLATAIGIKLSVRDMESATNEREFLAAKILFVMCVLGWLAGAGLFARQTMMGKIYSGRQVRVKYLNDVSKIKQLNTQWKQQGISLKDRAFRAWQIRHSARVEARNKMFSSKNVGQLRVRDSQKYGNPDGPTFEFLVDQAKNHGARGDAIYDSVLSGSMRTNKNYNP